MPTAPPASPAKPKTKQSHVRSIVQQILKEPFEIAKTAGNQITGGELQDTPQVNGANNRNVQGDPLNSQEAAVKRKREIRHYQAFQNEIAEIRNIQKQREQERQQLRVQEEQQKKMQEEQKKKKEQEGLIEPITRKARGMLGGAGAMLGVKRKQRSTELVKTPSN